MEHKTSKFLSDVFNAISLLKEIFRKTMIRKVQNKFFIFKQERGKSQRALLFGNSNYVEQAFKSLSITPINDLRDMINLLQKSNFATKNNFENVASKDHLNFILKNYVECINKEPEEIGKSFFTPASLCSHKKYPPCLYYILV